MAGMEALVRAKYAGLDFDTHVDDLLARLQVKFAADFNDFAVSSLAIVILDAISYGLDTLSFYLDRRATDAFLATARTRRSVSRLCRQLGYKMGAAIVFFLWLISLLHSLQLGYITKCQSCSSKCLSKRLHV